MYKFDLQLFANTDGQQPAPEDFGKMSAAQQADILGKMVQGVKPEPEPEEEEPEEEEKQPEPPAKRKLKVNGEEVELTEEEILEAARKGMSADKRFEEAAKLRKEAAAEREKIEAEKQQKNVDIGKGQLAFTKQQSAQFAQMFQQTFGEEYNPYDDDHRDIKTQYQVQQMLASNAANQNKTIIDNAKQWADANPDEIDKLDDAIYSLAAGDGAAKKQMRTLMAARDRFDNGNCSIQDLQMLEEFRKNATVTAVKPIPKEAIAEQKQLKAEKAGGNVPEKPKSDIDWDRFAKDTRYQEEVLGRRTRQK